MLFTANSYAENFRLALINDSFIQHNSDDWTIAARTNKYELYVNTTSIAAIASTVEVHSITEFYPPDGIKLEPIAEPVKRIYTYGIMECKKGIFNLLNSWYVDKNNKIVYNQVHEFGTYEIDVRPTNTPRNDLYQLVCNKQ